MTGKPRRYRLLGRRIQAERQVAGLTQFRAAEKSGITYSYWSQLENGYYCPSLSVLFTIAATLGVTVPWLLRDMQSAEAKR